MKAWLREDGSSVVEVSFASIFLFLLMLAAFELGTAFSAYIAVINASRAGASYASMHPSPSDAEYMRYADVAKKELDAAGLTSQVLVGLPITPEGILPERPVSVTVNYTWQPFSSGIALPVLGRLGLPSHYHVSWTTTMAIR
jgi:Flp pilus assembly protein TadG